jgi:hypothetical protein
MEPTGWFSPIIAFLSGGALAVKLSNQSMFLFLTGEGKMPLCLSTMPLKCTAGAEKT